MTCREAIEFLADYLDDALPLPTRMRFKSHLAVCASCRAYLATYETTIRLSRETFDASRVEEPPEELVRAILEAGSSEQP